MYDVHFGLIRKCVVDFLLLGVIRKCAVDFLLVLIEFFSLGVTAEGLRALNPDTSPISVLTGPDVD